MQACILVCTVLDCADVMSGLHGAHPAATAYWLINRDLYIHILGRSFFFEYLIELVDAKSTKGTCDNNSERCIHMV